LTTSSRADPSSPCFSEAVEIKMLVCFLDISKCTLSALSFKLQWSSTRTNNHSLFPFSPSTNSFWGRTDYLLDNSSSDIPKYQSIAFVSAEPDRVPELFGFLQVSVFLTLAYFARGARAVDLIQRTPTSPPEIGANLDALLRRWVVNWGHFESKGEMRSVVRTSCGQEMTEGCGIW
jgi:hypothetical protein